MTGKVTSNAGLDPDLLADLHRRQDAAIEVARATPPPVFEGAGIVIVAGGPRCFTNACVALTLLRDVHNTRLPIQVWHLGPEEMSPEMRRILKRFDVDLVDAFEVRSRFPFRRLGGWECKPYAVRHSPFRHVVLIDADNAPLIDPARLLELPQLHEYGAIFWPDNQSHPERSPVWELFRVPYRHELEVESGQMVIDKERCWVPLNLALHLNEWSDRYYQYVYGDKETFHFAWRHVGQDYAMPLGRPRIVYCHWDTPSGRKRMTAALEQRDFDGNVIFHHRTGAEWTLFGENPSTGRHELDAICMTALDELRRQWDGRVMRIEPLHAYALPGKGSASHRYLYRRAGSEERVIDLMPGGGIEAGRDGNERTWHIEERGAATTMVISGEEGDTCRLMLDADGAWRGRQLWYQRMPVELIPMGPAVSQSSASFAG